MFKVLNAINNNKANAKSPTKSSWEEPKMSIKKWYALQQKLREAQMAQARGDA